MTKRRTLILITLALTGIASPGLAREARTSGPPQENRVAEAESALARTPDFYFMMNLGSRTIDLKARGFVLRRWAPSRIRFWGSPVPFKALSLARKTALTPPQRRVIKPGEPETVSTKPGEFELEALEVKDMPPAYTLELEGGTKISVVPKAKGLPAVWRDMKWYVGLPLKTLKLRRQKRTITLIELSFEDPKEGQAMYWALTEGLKGLVWLPRSE
ncbi:MAG TPA: hypothetical protein VHP61_05830 [Acidobacteriota bacterium]|nr:hypothetical protein [Acidobacteriota bacterium]